MAYSPAIPNQSTSALATDCNEWSDVISKQYLDQVLPKHESSLFGGLQLRPKNTQFATQNKGEKVFILLRKHWLTNLGWVSSSVFYSLIPLIIYLVASVFGYDLINLLSAKLYLLLLLSYYALVASNVLRNFITWYFNVYLVTNERVVDFDVNVATTTTGASELELSNIEEVREKSTGILQSIFNYGDVYIYSAAHKREILFDDIPRPTFVRDKISDLSELIKRNRNES